MTRDYFQEDFPQESIVLPHKWLGLDDEGQSYTMYTIDSTTSSSDDYFRIKAMRELYNNLRSRGVSKHTARAWSESETQHVTGPRYTISMGPDYR